MKLSKLLEQIHDKNTPILVSSLTQNKRREMPEIMGAIKDIPLNNMAFMFTSLKSGTTTVDVSAAEIYDITFEPFKLIGITVMMMHVILDDRAATYDVPNGYRVEHNFLLNIGNEIARSVDKE
jgi:hypothetical protein